MSDVGGWVGGTGGQNEDEGGGPFRPLSYPTLEVRVGTTPSINPTKNGRSTFQTDPSPSVERQLGRRRDRRSRVILIRSGYLGVLLFSGYSVRQGRTPDL